MFFIESLGNKIPSEKEHVVRYPLFTSTRNERHLCPEALPEPTVSFFTIVAIKPFRGYTFFLTYGCCVGHFFVFVLRLIVDDLLVCVFPRASL